MSEQLDLFAEAPPRPERFVVRPNPSAPTEDKAAHKWTMRPTGYYVMDRLWLYTVVSRHPTEADAQARADELNRSHA